MYRLLGTRQNVVKNEDSVAEVIRDMFLHASRVLYSQVSTMIFKDKTIDDKFIYNANYPFCECFDPTNEDSLKKFLSQRIRLNLILGWFLAVLQPSQVRLIYYDKTYYEMNF